MAQARMGSSDGHIGVRDFVGCNTLLLITVKRLDPSYRGPFDPQAQRMDGGGLGDRGFPVYILMQNIDRPRSKTG